MSGAAPLVFTGVKGLMDPLFSSYVVKYDKKPREFIVKKKGSLEEAIEEMDKHLDYVNASINRPSWMIGNDWVDIFDTRPYMSSQIIFDNVC